MTDQRTHLGVRIFGAAQFHGLGLFLQGGDEFVENRPFDINALRAQADLAAIRKDGPHGAFDRRVEIGIREYDRGVLAAQFERQRFHVLRGRPHDRATGCRLAGERDGVAALVRGHKLAGRIGTEAVNDVERAVRHAGFFHHFRQHGRCGRRFFRRFQNNCVAG